MALVNPKTIATPSGNITHVLGDLAEDVLAKMDALALAETTHFQDGASAEYRASSKVEAHRRPDGGDKVRHL